MVCAGDSVTRAHHGGTKDTEIHGEIHESNPQSTVRNPELRGS